MMIKKGLGVNQVVKLEDFFTTSQIRRMQDNGDSIVDQDFAPVVYLSAPDLGYQWIINKIDKDDPNVVYGLEDLNDGAVRLGEINLAFIQELRTNGHDVFNSKGFSTDYKLSVFKKVSSLLNKILAPPDLFADEFKKANEDLTI